MKCVTMDFVKPKTLAPGMYAIHVEPILPRCRNNRKVHLDYLKYLKESVKTLHEIVEEARVESVNSCIEASGSKPRRNTKKNRISPAKSVNKKQVEEHPMTNKSSLKKANRVDYSISSKRTIVIWYLDSGCSKHMTGNRSRLRNFMKKFIGIVRYGNDHFGAIIGYGDYVIDNSVITRVYIGKFCDSDLEVAFKKHSSYVRDTYDVELIKGSSEVQENKVQLIQKLRDDKKHMKKVEPSSRSKAIEYIINIGSFAEALVLNHYVLVRKILVSSSKRKVFLYDVLDSPCLLVLITGTSQSRQHVITSSIHIESCKSPTKSLFDVGSSRISIFTVNTFVSLGCSGKFSRKMRRTLYYSL
nr:integrase, catalytic region, zinc finger, CCHC-type, peptidase aspartic, catalytic [Tanacetum cinerariifolium]